jgi:hypothetical protein
MLFDGCARSLRQPVAQGVVAQESCKRPGRRLFVARRDQEAVVAVAQGFGNTAGKPAGRQQEGTCAGSAHAAISTRGAGAFTRAPLRPSSRSVLVLPTRQPL